jgi:hypothetical protein
MVQLTYCCRRPYLPPPSKKRKKEAAVQVPNDLDPHDRAIARAAMKALATGLRLEVVYDGLPRIVEVHAIGLSQKGKPVMRVYQVLGDSHSGQEQGWKLMSLGKVHKMPQILDIKSAAPRPGYNPGDKGMLRIFTEV